MAVVATAGHVDHGKSTLVRLLTGTESDRWAQERERGLTIDLGYAWTDLDGVHLSLVDVPGHERFAANMLAGLGPVAGVMFVVAADTGWARQSEEPARAVAAWGCVRCCSWSPGATSSRGAGPRTWHERRQAGWLVSGCPPGRRSWCRAGPVRGWTTGGSRCATSRSRWVAPTPLRRCGCGSIGRSSCTVPAPWSPAP